MGIDDSVLGADDVLRTVFINGDLLNESTFDEVRERAAVGV
jgi:hypothetical protein